MLQPRTRPKSAPKVKTGKKTLAKVYSVLAIGFALGFGPVVFSYVVDPYQVFNKKDRPTEINELAEKTHYPLFKLAKFKPDTFDTIVLGDSRARALSDKYWRENGVPMPLNLAYGGGTIPEIYSTFQQFRNNHSIRRLVIGIQLRSLDEDHKDGMNRVPEAVGLLNNKINYLKNWHVIKTALKVFEAEHEGVVERVNKLGDAFSLEAKAESLGSPGETTLSKLLEPKVCFGCELPVSNNIRKARKGFRLEKYKGFAELYTDLYDDMNGISSGNKDLTVYQQLDVASLVGIDDVKLPKKFEAQIKGSGKADWTNFKESEEYWSYLEEISAWAKTNQVELAFVIPPTVVPLQELVYTNGFASKNHEFRTRLAEMGRVYDLDFPNELTLDIENFNDAYHFNSSVSRTIVEQVVSGFNGVFLGKKPKGLVELECLPSKEDGFAINILKRDGMYEGENCRLWEKKS